jgi:hypothetical protein
VLFSAGCEGQFKQDIFDLIPGKIKADLFQVRLGIASLESQELG